MNKKEAVAYAQITLDYMQSSKYTGEINAETQKDKIEVRKNEEERPSETLTLQKVDGDWKVVYSEIMNVFMNSKGGGTITWEVY